jgi:hypothetical protein
MSGPRAYIVVYAEPVTEELVAANRHFIQASGLLVVGEPVIRRVPNDGYIIQPDAPSECYQVIFQVDPEGLRQPEPRVG